MNDTQINSTQQHGNNMYYLGVKHTASLVDILYGYIPREIQEALEKAKAEADTEL